MLRFGIAEVLVIIALIVVLILIIGPKRIARLLGKAVKPINLLIMASLVIGYILGSRLLPLLVYTSWERHVVGINSSSYTSGLRGDYSATALLGGIIGSIFLSALALIVSRLLKKT